MIKNRQQAMKEAKRRWGKNATIRDNGWRNARTKEERESARAQLRELNANKPTDKEQYREWKKRRDDVFVIVYCYQYSVGEITSGPFQAFCVHGQGDSWDDAFAEVDRRAQIDRERYARTGHFTPLCSNE